MPDGVLDVAMLLACSLAAVGGGRLLGSRMWLGHVITTYRRDEWPYDASEPDAPAVAVSHAEALRPNPRGVAAVPMELDDGLPVAEIVELYVRGYTRPSHANRR
jgi:hypothetical protein